MKLKLVLPAMWSKASIISKASMLNIGIAKWFILCPLREALGSSFRFAARTLAAPLARGTEGNFLRL